MPEFNPTIHCYLKSPRNRARLESLAGQEFNRLTVYGFLGRQYQQSHWLCRCKCGKWWVTTSQRLKNGQSQSCGCWNYDKTPAATHGLSKTRTYGIYGGMRTRIFNLENKSSKNYGRKGLTICEGFNTFEKFSAIVGDCPSDIHSIDRYPDQNGGYWCGECSECQELKHSKNWRWATPKEQCANLKKNIWLTHEGETLIVAEWARRTGITPNTIHGRLRLGWSTEEALGLKERQTAG